MTQGQFVFNGVFFFKQVWIQSFPFPRLAVLPWPEALYAPTQHETLLHSLERAVAGIGFHDNAHKMEYMCFNKRGNIFTLNGCSLKVVDKFTYLGSGVSSTETNINTLLAKAWTAFDRLSVIWKSELTDKIKRILPSSSRVPTAIWMHYMNTN